MTEKNADPRADRSRRALLDAAIELLLENPGASLSDLATHAGVGRATLYRHFKSREELVHAAAVDALLVTDEVLQPIKDDADLTARQALEAGMRAIMPIADRFHFLLLLWNIAEGDKDAMKIYQRQLDDLSRLVDRGKRERSITDQLSTPWIVYLCNRSMGLCALEKY